MSNQENKRRVNPTSSLIDEFVENLDRMKNRLTSEDLEIAMESLRVFADFERQMKAREEREKAEERAPEVKADTTEEESGEIELPMDWDEGFDDAEKDDIHAESVADGLIYSLNNRERVDIRYISKITGVEPDEVIKQLHGSIYQDPERWNEDPYEGWVTADEYLSGNLMAKWRAVTEACRVHKRRFLRNKTAISEVLPESVATKDIYITIGSPWVPPDIIDDFIIHLMDDKFKKIYKDRANTRYDESTGIWEIPFKTRFSGGRYLVRSSSTYGTKRMEMLTLLEHTLNQKTVAVYDSVASNKTKSGKVMVLNEDETVLALEKQSKLIELFQKWVWKDEKRRDRLQEIYDSRYGAICRRRFDGSFLTLPTLSPSVELYDYQKNAVARILFTPNTLLAHDVGSGKTLVMIAAGMEKRRIGTSRKNLYVVPNNLVGQWRETFLRMYPNANLLCIDPKSFTRDRRTAVLCKIRDGDYDGIIMAYSCFDMIPLSEAYYDEAYRSAVELLRRSMPVFNSPTTIERKIKSMVNEFEKVKAKLQGSVYGIPFDELGITGLFVDEIHNYKNIPVDTKITKVLGISSAGSEKCREMLEKVKCVQRENRGGGVVLATGTPITNSITDIFVMQKYLQPGELAMLGIGNFDSWVAMFAERHTDFEVDVDTGSYRMATRFSKFHNLTELTSILASIADFHVVDKEDGLPDFDGYTDCVVGRTAEFDDYLKSISQRADLVRSRAVTRKEDNMLKITTDGRKAALDLRLVDDKASFTYNSKVARCAENVFSVYTATKQEGCAQIVFCDTSTPKSGFNIYDELSSILKSMGIPESEIAYIHEATTEKKRDKLFEAVRAGEIRVLIGSTFKLGLGVNVQERLIAIHHIDVPWRPADMVQREGRILRRGNTCQRVQIFRYVTEGSFDAYSWQLLETKQRFICSLLAGSLDKRDGSDVDGTVLSYAEVKAIAIGNPLMKKRVETANELGRYYILHREAVEGRERLRRELAELPVRIERQRKHIANCVKDIVHYTENRIDYDKENAKLIRERIDRAIRTSIDVPEEVEIMSYQGFRVVIPPFTPREKPCVVLEREGKYYVEMGESEKGVLIRIDNFLEGFGKHFERLNKGLMNLLDRESAIVEELKRDVGYADLIESCRRRLERLDEQLGVA